MNDPILENIADLMSPVETSGTPDTAIPAVPFDDVSVKDDGSFVVTVAGNRCHVTQDYNPPLYEAVRSFLERGGAFRAYAEDIIVQSDPAVLARLWIEVKLQTSEAVVAQYRDARDLGGDLPITAEQFTQLLTWRQSVREWPKVAGYPDEATQPQIPGWMQAVLTNGE